MTFEAPDAFRVEEREEIPADSKVAEPESLRSLQHRIIDYMVANPKATYKQVAAHFDVTEGWLGHLRTSDMFQAALKRRGLETHIAPVFSSTASARKSATTEVVIEAILDRLHRDSRHMDIKDLTHMARLVLEASGDLNSQANGQNLHQNLQVVVSPDSLARARDRIAERGEALAIPPVPRRLTRAQSEAAEAIDRALAPEKEPINGTSTTVGSDPPP